MPARRRNLRHQPRIHDNLSLVRRFIVEVPIRGRQGQAFRRAAVEALDEVIFILLPTGPIPPCPTVVLPRGVEPYLAMLPCKTKVIQRTVEGGLASIPLHMPVCGTIIPKRDIEPMLKVVATGMRLCGRAVLPKNIRPPVVLAAKAKPRRKK